MPIFDKLWTFWPIFHQYFENSYWLPHILRIFFVPVPPRRVYIYLNLSYISLIFWQILAFFDNIIVLFWGCFAPPLNFILIADFGQIMKILAHIPWLFWGYFLTPLLLNGDFATFKITLHVVPFLTNYVIFAYNTLVLFWGDPPPRSIITTTKFIPYKVPFLYEVCHLLADIQSWFWGLWTNYDVFLAKILFQIMKFLYNIWFWFFRVFFISPLP